MTEQTPSDAAVQGTDSNISPDRGNVDPGGDKTEVPDACFGKPRAGFTHLLRRSTIEGELAMTDASASIPRQKWNRFHLIFLGEIR